MVGVNVAVQGAVVLLVRVEHIHGGDLLPFPVRGGLDVSRHCLVEEACHVPLGELFGMFGDERLHDGVLLLSVLPPEPQLQVADGGGAASHAGQEQVYQHEGGDQEPTKDLWTPETQRSIIT